MSYINGKRICAVLLGAGSSMRMGRNKMAMRFCGKTPFSLCLEAFSGIADEAVIAVSPDTELLAREAAEMADIPVSIVQGGRRRQDSVYNAIMATEADIVAVHDCARCLVGANVIKASIDSAARYGSGVASVRPVDTLRIEATGETVDRDMLLAAQTPQSFDRALLFEAYDRIDPDVTYTDDAAIFRAAGFTVHNSEGSRLNLKLTTPEDAALFNALFEAGICGNNKKREALDMRIRIGYGEDTHRLTEGRKLVLGGVDVPFEFGLDGHSDADVITHALIDAVLGACAMGDIGRHFPDTDIRYKGVSSLILAKEIAGKTADNGYFINNLDVTLVAQKPTVAKYADEMRNNIAAAFGISADAVSVKFTTPEHTGPEGRGESMTARAAASVYCKN